MTFLGQVRGAVSAGPDRDDGCGAFSGFTIARPTNLGVRLGLLREIVGLAKLAK
jgi:hypothetical protein